MKKTTLLFVTVVVLFAATSVFAAVGLKGSTKAYMPVIYDSSAKPSLTPQPTHTNTPRPPTPTATPTPTPSYTDESTYDWVHVALAQLSKDKQTVLVFGNKPGACYNVEIDRYTEDGMVLLRSHELVLGTYPCSIPPYNPDGVWPPLQFPPPPDPLPADWDWFMYGEVYSLVVPRSVKVVCGAGDSIFGTTDCYKVIRPGE